MLTPWSGLGWMWLESLALRLSEMVFAPYETCEGGVPYLGSRRDGLAQQWASIGPQFQRNGAAAK